MTSWTHLSTHVSNNFSSWTSGIPSEGSWLEQKYIYLVEVTIYSRPLRPLVRAYLGRPKGWGIFKHDYVFVKYRLPGSSDIKYFVSEKLPEPVKRRSLSCEYVNMEARSELPGKGHDIRLNVDLKGAKVSVQELRYTLETDGHFYDVVNSNCWKYAHGTTAKVIELCQRSDNLKIDDWDSLFTHVIEFDSVERRMPTFATGLSFLLRPWDRFLKASSFAKLIGQ